MLKLKRWSRPATIAFSLLFIAIMCFTVLPSPVQIGHLSFGGAGVASATTETFTTSGYWICPVGVTTVQVEVWGAGSKGTDSWYYINAWLNGQGGGGGAYSINPSYAVTPGGNYTYVVGSGTGIPGGDSYFNNSTAVMAKGGTAPNVCNTNNPGGDAASGYGTTKYSGGAGWGTACAPAPSVGTGGGSSAGTASNGTAATSQTGATAPTGGGNGGNGGNNNTNGSAGTAPGGGGGGSGSGSGKVGGVGGAGKIILTYTNITIIATLAATSITATSVTLNGNVTYLGSYGNVTSYGFVLSTSAKSSPGNVSPSAQTTYTAGNWTWTSVQYAAGQTFNSSGNVTGLTLSTSYYFRAAGYSTYGWVYGDELTFTTLCASVGFATNWLTYGGVAYSNRRALGITAATNPAPANYKVPVDIHRGNKTVEDGNWTVNSKTYNNRIAFTVHTHDALTATYPLKIIIDTSALVTGGFFGGSTSGYAKTVEFGNSSSDTTGMKFWVTESGAATPDNFNTSATIYYISLPSGLTANTDHTMYIYIDADQGGASSNYSAANIFTFFEHFDTAVGNLTAFLAAYDGSGGTNNWNVSISDPIISVASSILTLDSASYSGDWRSIVPASLSITDWRMLARIPSAMGENTGIGMVAADVGVPGTNSFIYQENNIVGFDRWVASLYHSSFLGSPIPAPCSIEISKSGTRYNMATFRDRNDTAPDWQLINSVVAIDDIPFNLWIGSITTNDIDVDWIAVMPEMDAPPFVTFPNILYDKAGTVFLGGNSLHWPYDIAFTSVDGNITLKWWADPLAELTKQPGDSMQATVRVVDSLSCDSKIYIYYGHDNVTSIQADCSPTSTYDTFYDFTDITDWTDAAGYSIVDVVNPILYHGIVGNTGGQSGRLWAREPSVAKWGTNDYRMVFGNALWEETAAGWPVKYRVNTAYASSPTSVFSPAKTMFTDGAYESLYSGYWADSLKIYDGVAYEIYSVGDGFRVAHCHTSDDPDISSNWTINPNGAFITGQWLIDNGGGEYAGTTSIMSYALAKKGSTYYIFFSGVSNGHPGYVYTTDAPENWTTSSFTYGDWLLDPWELWLEDSDVVYDSVSENWIWAFTCPENPQLRYYYISNANFPGIGTSAWTYGGSLNPVVPPFGSVLRSPRLLQDGTDWYLYFSCAGLDDTGWNRWIPNYITVNKAGTTGFPGNWTAQNTEKKYYQATTTEIQKAYITTSSETNCSIITEVQLGYAATYYQAGILFRYNSGADTGYYAALDYNAGNPKVQLYKFSGASYTSLNSVQGAVPYDIPQFPDPWLYPGYTWRLRVQAYGTTIKVAYSAWGNAWVETHSLTDATYSTGKVGVETSSAAAYFNNFRVRGFVLTEPIVGQATEEEFNISNTPSSKNFGVVQPSSTYWAIGAEPSWPLADGNCTETVTNNSSFAVNILYSMGSMTGGTTWTIGASPASNVFTMKVFKSGAGNITVCTILSATPQEVIHELAAGNHIHWEFVLYTPTNTPQFADGTLKSGTMTLAAEVH